MASDSSPLCSFSPNHDSFAIVHGDNRITVIDTVTAKVRLQCVETKHLVTQYTCFDWGTHLYNARNVEYLVAGTENGTVLVWDLVQGQIVYTWDSSKGGHTQTVTDVLFSNGNVFTCSLDKLICQWSVETGELIYKFKEDNLPLRKLALSPDGKFLASASSAIKVYELASKNVTKKFTGHSSPITALKFSPDGKNLLSCSQDRSIYMWTLKEKNPKVFTLNGVPKALDVNKYLDVPEKFHFLSLTEGKVRVWDADVDLKDITSSSEGSTIMAASFMNVAHVVVAYGTYAKPAFQRIHYFDPNNLQIIQKKIVASIQKDKAKLMRQKEVADKVTIVPGNEIPLQKPRDAKDAESVEEVKPLAERVEELDSNFAPKADSLQAVLAQAIHTNDDRLLESCIAVTDIEIIENTVKRLPTAHVLPFLTILINKFQSKPSRGVTMVTWIRTILVEHTSYLMTMPDLVKTLSGLYLIVDSRLTVFKKLLKLSGRMDLLLSQINTVKKSSAVASSVYEESDGEASDDLGMEDDEGSEEEEDDGNMELKDEDSKDDEGDSMEGEDGEAGEDEDAMEEDD